MANLTIQTRILLLALLPSTLLAIFLVSFSLYQTKPLYVIDGIFSETISKTP